MSQYTKEEKVVAGSVGCAVIFAFAVQMIILSGVIYIVVHFAKKLW